MLNATAHTDAVPRCAAVGAASGISPSHACIAILVDGPYLSCFPPIVCTIAHCTTGSSPQPVCVIRVVHLSRSSRCKLSSTLRPQSEVRVTYDMLYTPCIVPDNRSSPACSVPLEDYLIRFVPFRGFASVQQRYGYREAAASRGVSALTLFLYGIGGATHPNSSVSLQHGTGLIRFAPT